jgi:hypothetical protein
VRLFHIAASPGPYPKREGLFRPILRLITTPLRFFREQSHIRPILKMPSEFSLRSRLVNDLHLFRNDGILSFSWRWWHCHSSSSGSRLAQKAQLF